MHKRFVSTVPGLFPLQHICEFVLKRLEALLAYGLGWHLRILPDEKEMDRGQLWVPPDNIAGDGTWKGMPIRALDLRELFDQPPLLASTYWHLNLGGQHVTSRIIHPPPWGNSACTSRRIELELPDVFLYQEENATG